MKIKRIAPLALAALLAFSAACSSSRGQVRTMTGEDYFKQAEGQMAARKYEEAKQSLEQARRLFRSGDEDARLLAMLGDANFALKEYQEALAAYEEFLKLHPRNPLAPRVQYQIGLSHYNMIRPKDRNPRPAYDALEAFTRAKENYPRSPEAREAEAKIEATRSCLGASELFVGQFYFRKGNYRGAIGRFETILKDYPGCGLEEEALYYLGESHRLLKEAGKAQEYYRLLLDRYPSGRYSKQVRNLLEERRG